MFAENVEHMLGSGRPRDGPAWRAESDSHARGSYAQRMVLQKPNAILLRGYSTAVTKGK